MLRRFTPSSAISSRWGVFYNSFSAASSLSTSTTKTTSIRTKSTTSNTLSSFDDYILNSPESFIQRKPEIAGQLKGKRAELELMQRKYDDAVQSAESKVKLMGAGMAVLLIAQWGVLFNWVFFMFDWNLVEPVTYFLGASCAWFAAFWYSTTGHEWSYKGWNETTAQRMARKKLCSSDPKFMEKFEGLVREVEELHKMENSIYVALDGDKI